jgi:outer membrane lipoprotein-sorting protein
MLRYAISIRRASAAAWACAAMGAFAATAGAQSADEILARADENASFKSIRYEGRMEISIGGEVRVKSMVAVAEGSAKALVEFTNPEDRGTRFLKLDKDLWMYFPKEQDTVKISGHLLKEGMMGSDVSYEDALESADYRERYTASLKGREEVDGRPCFVVELSAKSPKAPYERRVMWIDAERYVSLKEEMYAKSGRLLKVSRTLETVKLGGRWFASKVEMESKLRRDTKTLFAMGKVELDPKLDPRQFTMAALTK